MMAKEAKRFVKVRVHEISTRRPTGSQPADSVLRRAVQLYDKGNIRRANLRDALARLEADLRDDIPDFLLVRAPRSVSSKPRHVGLMVYETRVVHEGKQTFITAENHTLILREDSIIFVSGLMPGGTRPHLFERVVERQGNLRTLAEVQLEMTKLWPTLLWMRTEQRLARRGSPIATVVTPFQGGLLFGTIEKTVELPPAGPTRAIVDISGTDHRTLHDFYGRAGDRIWMTTNTFVDAGLLTPLQIDLKAVLAKFIQRYPDVIAENDWRWRFGLGDNDIAVDLIAKTFKLSAVSESRRSSALNELEKIVSSPIWVEEAARNLENQQARKAAWQTKADKLTQAT